MIRIKIIIKNNNKKQRCYAFSCTPSVQERLKRKTLPKMVCLIFQSCDKNLWLNLKTFAVMLCSSCWGKKTTTKKNKTSAPVMKCVTLAYIGVADWAGPGHRQVQGIAKCCQSHTDSSTPLSPEEDKPHRIISGKKTLECKKIYILQMYRYKKIVKHKSAIIHGSPGHDDPDPRSSLY